MNAGFRHVVLLGFVDDAPDGAVDEVVAALRALPEVIPEIRDYHVGRDAGLREDNHHVVVVADFDDEAGFHAYQEHPEHQRVVVELIRPILAARAAVQTRTRPGT